MDSYEGMGYEEVCQRVDELLAKSEEPGGLSDEEHFELWGYANYLSL